MKLCILGGTGFLGRHLCEALQARAMPAVAISRNPDHGFLAAYAPLVSGLALGSAEARAALKVCDVLVHLASVSLPGINWDDPAAELERCALSEVRFLQDFAQSNPRARIVYASSGGQIYGSGYARPIPDDVRPAPRTAYALSKQVVEASLNILSVALGNPVTILRIANPIGRWQLGRKHGLVSTAIAAGLAGIPLTLFGEGTNVRDYFDADDFAAFLIDHARTLETSAGTYNVGSDLGLTERDVIAVVSRVIDRPIQVETRPGRPFDLAYALLDSSRARRALGWTPTTGFEASVRKIAAAYAAKGVAGGAAART